MTLNMGYLCKTIARPSRERKRVRRDNKHRWKFRIEIVGQPNKEEKGLEGKLEYGQATI